MDEGGHADLGRRERQIVEVLFRSGPASASEIRAQLPDPPSYSAVRGTLSVLERKGHVQHERRGRRYVWQTTVQRDTASRSALRRLVRTFFGGSTTRTVAALLHDSTSDLSPAELDRLARLIERARDEGR